MTELDEGPLDAEQRAILRADRQVPVHEVRDRLASRLATSVGALLVGGLPNLRALPPRAGHFEVLRRLARAYPLAFAGTFALGVAVGAAAHAVLRRGSPHEAAALRTVAPLSVPPADSARVPPQSAEPSVAAAVEPATVPQDPRASASPRPTPSASDGLAAQQALLDTARKALTREDFAAALAALEAHAARYPKSALSEEREALLVKVLVAVGRFSEARQRGALFAERFPHSFLLSSVNDSLSTIP